MSRHAITASAVVGIEAADVDTVVVEDGSVVAVARSGQLGDIPNAQHPAGTIVPAFTDSHLHPLGYAALVSGVSLNQASTPAELHELLSEAASRLPPTDALMAQRLSEAPLGRLPTRHDLDAAVPDRPTIAYRYCGHVAVLNTAALRVTGIDEHTPDPPDGSLDRDTAGYPTGILRETAVDLVGPALEPLLPPPPSEQVLAALTGLVAAGISHIGAMAAADQPLWCGVGNELTQLCDLAPDLPVDMDVMVIADTPEELEHAARRIDQAGGRLNFWGWKAFADGSLGGHTAAMWEPFVDVDTTGILRLDPELARHMAGVALDLGGVVAIHAIGDRAVDQTLDLFDRLLSTGVDPNRLRMEHVSILTDTAIRRFADTGVVASVQPSFLTSESSWVPARLGPDRSPYRFGSMRRAGVRMIGGSDCPVERPDPLVGIAAATHRKGWGDGERLSVKDSLALYTSTAAAHFGRSRPLAEGSPADLVVVEGELGTEEAEVSAVYLGGESQPLRPVPWPG